MHARGERRRRRKAEPARRVSMRPSMSRAALSSSRARTPLKGAAARARRGSRGHHHVDNKASGPRRVARRKQFCTYIAEASALTLGEGWESQPPGTLWKSYRPYIVEDGSWAQKDDLTMKLMVHRELTCMSRITMDVDDDDG